MSSISVASGGLVNILVDDVYAVTNHVDVHAITMMKSENIIM